MFWTTKKELKAKIAQLEHQLKERDMEIEIIEKCRDHIQERTNYLVECFPLELGATVYVLELRNSKGRFTKSKACKEHSSISEVVVDTKNYFKLVERYRDGEAFTVRTAAECQLTALCVD